MCFDIKMLNSSVVINFPVMKLRGGYGTKKCTEFEKSEYYLTGSGYSDIYRHF